MLDVILFKKGMKKAEKYSDHSQAHVQYYLSVSNLCLYYKNQAIFFFCYLLRALFVCPWLDFESIKKNKSCFKHIL